MFPNGEKWFLGMLQDSRPTRWIIIHIWSSKGQKLANFCLINLHIYGKFKYFRKPLFFTAYFLTGLNVKKLIFMIFFVFKILNFRQVLPVFIPSWILELPPPRVVRKNSENFRRREFFFNKTLNNVTRFWITPPPF